ncbi:hypothetical protein SEUBUCD646_0M00400 [Saccharomyces eubayanus]|uniref:Pre-mRNA leakage protein 39 n=2 Tax=Saccharomyces TaxID=4930 RepID=A0A6C1ECI2_SACPS|nr:Pre-mRNA leakage protein 39 [Saccharomyces pastorianus]CAI1615032.1 hypothetical protein SEUBUCD650_0M00390 [Saccharomyces eubayanus]CAI1641846.1 hypothetical protein SEUBUCD646_0M00400 [Saccharomyces eubayanus]
MDEDKLDARLGSIRDSLRKKTKLASRKAKDTLAQRVITKWRYRKKAYDGSSILPERCKNRVQLFDDLVHESSSDFAGFQLHDSRAMLERICLTQNYTRLMLIEWDVRWVNPLTLASKGWKPYQGQSRAQAIFKCCCCHAIMSMHLSKNDDSTADYNRKLNEKIWHSNVINNHLDQCPWKRNQFDVNKEYHLSSQTLIIDIERIYTDIEKITSGLEIFNLKRNSSRIFYYLTEKNMQKLASFFNCNDYSLLGLLLLGYTKFEKEDLVQCTACFHRASVKRLEHTDFNGHALWCRYYNKELLSIMLLELIDEKDNAATKMNVEERLNKLEIVLQTL